MSVIVTSANSPYDVSSGQIDTGDVVSSGGQGASILAALPLARPINNGEQCVGGGHAGE